MSSSARTRLALALGVVFSVAATPVAAGGSLEQSLSLSLSKSLRDRMFWNVQVVSTKTKTKSEEPRDITGPVVRLDELATEAQLDEYLANNDLAPQNRDNVIGLLLNQIDGIVAAANGGPLSDPELARLLAIEAKLGAYVGQVLPSLRAAVEDDFANGNATIDDGLGTPKGIKARSGNPSATVALSVGYHLDDAHKWAVEALLLGAPLKVSVYGDGQRSGGGGDFAITGQEIIRTKLLPPLVKFGYTFGERDWVVRPYVGVAAMYAIFFNSRTTRNFDQYQGGPTSVSIKNAFGIGPMLGLSSGDLNNSGWRVGFSIGKVKLKTEATLVTRNTLITSDSAVSGDYGPATTNAIKNIGEDNARTTAINNLNNALIGDGLAPGSATVFQDGLTTELIRDLIAVRAAREGSSGASDLGTFVRKQRTTLDNTLFMLSVGRSF